MTERNIYGVYRATGAPLRRARKTRNARVGTRSIYASKPRRASRRPRKRRTRRDNRPHTRRVR